MLIAWENRAVRKGGKGKKGRSARGREAPDRKKKQERWMLCGEARMKRGRKGRKRMRGIDTRGKIAHRAKKAEEGRNKVGPDAEGAGRGDAVRG